MKLSKRICSLLLCAVLLLSCFPSVRAAEPKTKDLGAYTFDMTYGAAYYPTDDDTLSALTTVLLYSLLGGGLSVVDTDVFDVNGDGIADMKLTKPSTNNRFESCDGASAQGPVEIKLPADTIQQLESNNSVKAFYSSVVFVLPTWYDLWVCGVRVTTANKSPAGDYSIYYNADRNELRFNQDADFTAAQSYKGALVYSEIDGLTVVSDTAIKGTHTITTAADYCFYSAAPNINFRGNLRFQSAKECVHAVNMHLMGFALRLKGGDCAVNAEQTLRMTDGSLYASTTNTADACAVLAGKSIELVEHMPVQYPSGGEIKTLSNVGGYATCATVTASGELTPADYVEIYAKQCSMTLSFDGIYATEANREDILHNGVFSFDGDHTVTVKGDYDGRYSNIICNHSSEDLTIRVEEDSTLHIDGIGVIGGYGNMTITGPGKLALWSSASGCLWIDHNKTLTLEDLYLETRGAICINGEDDAASNSLVIRNSCVLAKSTLKYGIYQFGGGITLEGCELMQPAGGSVGPTSILDAEGNLAVQVVIGTPGFRAYDLSVDSKWVTSLNQDDILGNGVFSYADGTLRINGSHTTPINDSSWGRTIVSDIPDLTIYTAKDAELTAAYYPIMLYGGGTITGPGHLTVNGRGTAIWIAQDQTLRVYHTAITAISTNDSGIDGANDGGVKLVIDGSDITAVGEGLYRYWAVTDCTIELKDAKLVSPENGSFGTFHYTIGSYEYDVMSVLDAGGNPAQEAVFAETLPRYTVTFQDGGHGTAPADQTVRKDETAQEPAALTEDGWIFQGWYADKACTTKYDFTAPVTGNLTIWAKWTEAPIYTVTFQPNGHGDAPEAQSVKEGKTAKEPIAPAEDGWIFEGWFADKACTAEYDFTAPVTKNISVYAKWSKAPSPTDGLPCSGGDDCPGKVFTDMPVKGNWAHDPIDWAVVMKITTGTSPTTFTPDAACTRAQAVSFLWRAAGAPEPTSDKNPFKDVRKGTFYYKAVLWAVEKGITNGTSATTFSPDVTCTRGQIMTFVWRYEGEPKASTTFNPFTDVKPGAFYEQAVLWASETDVTKGIGKTTFSPNSNCTRAQIVTFLYRALNRH